MDPAVLSSCIPGCEKFEADGDGRYNVTLTIGLAAITGTYSGTVVLADMVPQTSYRLIVEGQGRPGFVKGSSAIALRADGATTIVDVSGTVQTGGPIVRVGLEMAFSRFQQSPCGRDELIQYLREAGYPGVGGPAPQDT